MDVIKVIAGSVKTKNMILVMPGRLSAEPVLRMGLSEELGVYRLKHDVKLEDIVNDKHQATAKFVFSDGNFAVGTMSAKIFRIIYSEVGGPNCTFASINPPASGAQQDSIPNPMHELAGVVALFFFVVFVGIMYVGLTAEDAPKSPPSKWQAQLSDAQGTAGALCKELVRSSLKAPRTAKFPWIADTTFDGVTAVISSYVDAQNSFGAVLRMPYTCTIDYAGGPAGDSNNWTIKNFSVEEP